MKSLLSISIIFLTIFRIDAGEGFNFTCGRRLVEYNSLIIDGFPSNNHWPWHAAIYHIVKQQGTTTEPQKNDYKCGGTLIDSNSVLTAAHCVSIDNERLNPENVSVSLGKLNLVARESSSQTFTTLNIILHPEYNSIDQSNDIAIIRLAADAIYNNFVQPICLWDTNKSELSEVIGRDGRVIGWGVTGTDNLSNALRQAFMPVIPSLACLASNRYFFGSFLSDRNFCAGFRNGTSVCNGDSGGSMTFEQNGLHYIRGIVSVSPARNAKSEEKRMLCDPNEYVIFTDVAKYLSWIKDVTQVNEKVISQPIKESTESPDDRLLGEPPTNLSNPACGRRFDISLISIEKNWPWHAAIYRIAQQQDPKYDCGGSLINSRLILTVAHCVSNLGEPKKPEEILVFLGRDHLDAYDGSLQWFNVAKIVIHPNFMLISRVNNIAMLQLATEATINNYVHPVCLWNSNKLNLAEVIGKRGTVIGWGVSETGELANTLQEESMPVVSSSTCLSSNSAFKNLLFDTTFCAGYRNGTSVCQGFSGGSMTFTENGVYYIRGIVSSGLSGVNGVCNRYEYVLFTDVAQYLPWIEQVTSHLI